MSDNQTPYDGDAWQGADQVTVNGYGTVADIVLAATIGGEGMPDALRALWLEKPESLLFALAREIMRRDAEFERVVQETISENAEIGQSLAEAQQDIQTLTRGFDAVEEHYHLALAVTEAAAVYIAAGGEGDVAPLFDDLVASMARFDGYEGPVQVDAMAGDRVAVSAVPAYEGDEQEEPEQAWPRPALFAVPDSSEDQS